MQSCIFFLSHVFLGKSSEISIKKLIRWFFHIAATNLCRLERERQYTERRLKDFEDALEREAVSFWQKQPTVVPLKNSQNLQENT